MFVTAVNICYMDLSQRLYCHGNDILYLNFLSTWICLLEFVLEIKVYCIILKYIVAVKN